MRLKKVGAVLTGCALLGATLVGAFAQSIPPLDFFVNVKTGAPHILIVVGSKAAASDVEAATALAVKIGTLDVVKAANRNSKVSKIPVSNLNLVVLDTQITLADWEAAGDYNLVLIGGPVANMLVKQLVDEGLSTVDWVISPGEWEYLKAPHSGEDILIVAGADREATRAAVQALINQL